MTEPQKASTDWREQSGADDEARYAGYGRQFAQLQARKSRKWGVGGALHRKQLTAARGTLTVSNGLPEWAAQGLFSHSGSYETWVRLSNGGMDRASDRIPDIRGLGLRVLGVRGESALGGPAVAQCFTLINHEAFAFARSDEFVDFAMAASEGGGALLRYLVRRYGLFGGSARMLQLAKTVGKAFGGFATEPLFSAVPMANGPYAVRVRLLPDAANGEHRAGAAADWGGDFAARLAAGPLQWDLQLQPFVSENLTPIEDASVNWPTPYRTVARLTLPRQNTASEEGRQLLADAEAAVFDPWQALAAHRPLGDVQRARKVVYFESQKGRGAA